MSVAAREEVPAALDGERVDRVVALVLDYSRQEAAALLAAGEVQAGQVVLDLAHQHVFGAVGPTEGLQLLDVYLVDGLLQRALEVRRSHQAAFAGGYEPILATGPASAGGGQASLNSGSEGALHFTSNAAARKARNIAATGVCSVSVTTDEMDLVIEGVAELVTDPALLERIRVAYDEKYG